MRRSCALLVLALLLSLATIATVTALASARAQIAADTREITAILLLFLAFAVVYRRSLRARRVAEQLAAENAQLAAANREEARTDALTLLRNRRALIDDLELELALADDQRPLMITRFDLDGFTHYNDTFGHPSGDRLLARLGQRLQAAVIGTGTAYRIGGDEFGLLTRLDSEAAGSLVERAAEALSDEEVKRIALGAELHDVGKTAIPDALRAEAIPLGARIIAVCDAFDAMISDRSYRSAMTTADAVVMLRRCAGTQFDPLIIEVFCALVVDGNATVPAAREYAPAA